MSDSYYFKNHLQRFGTTEMISWSVCKTKMPCKTCRHFKTLQSPLSNGQL